jgi:hypothetical protein
MKKFLIVCLLLLFSASSSYALEGTARVTNVGYTQAWFVIDHANSDTGMWKTVLFVGKTIATIARIDSITGTHTDPDTIANAVGTFENGVTYYCYLELTDSSATTHTTIRIPSSTNNYITFTLDDFTQNLTITTGYSTANVIHDSVGYYVAPLDSVIFRYGTVSGTYTDSSVITTVTHPDTVALTGLMEGGTYYGIMVAFLADSSIVDSSAEFSFSTTDLTVGVTAMALAGDSVGVIVDTNVIIVDSLIFQNGAGAVTVVAETLTTVTGVDTFYMTSLIPGGIYSYRVLAFLPDSSVVETTGTSTYSRPHSTFINDITLGRFGQDALPSNYAVFPNWDFDNSSDGYSTGSLLIESDWIKVSVKIDGEDDVSTGDSIQVFLWSFNFGDSTAIDTLVPMENDTVTITPLAFRMHPDEITDSSMTYYPKFDWGTHYGISAAMNDTTTNEGLVQGVRSVHVIIEEMD